MSYSTGQQRAPQKRKIKLTPIKQLKQKIHVLLPSYQVDKTSAFLLTNIQVKHDKKCENKKRQQRKSNLRMQDNDVENNDKKHVVSVTSRSKSKVEDSCQKFGTSFVDARNTNRFGIVKSEQGKYHLRTQSDLSVYVNDNENSYQTKYKNFKNSLNNNSRSCNYIKTNTQTTQLQQCKECKFVNKRNNQFSIKSNLQINRSRLHNRSQNSNNDKKQKVSNLLKFKKRKAYSEHSISIAYQNLLPNSTHLKTSSPASRQILRLTKIREMYRNMNQKKDNHVANTEANTVDNKLRDLSITPQKILLNKSIKPQNNKCDSPKELLIIQATTQRSQQQLQISSDQLLKTDTLISIKNHKKKDPVPSCRVVKFHVKNPRINKFVENIGEIDRWNNQEFDQKYELQFEKFHETVIKESLGKSIQINKSQKKQARNVIEQQFATENKETERFKQINKEVEHKKINETSEKKSTKNKNGQISKKNKIKNKKLIAEQIEQQQRENKMLTKYKFEQKLIKQFQNEDRNIDDNEDQNAFFVTRTNTGFD